LLLEVMEGYGGGEAVFEVFNNGVSMGKTTDVPLADGSPSCKTDPTVCYGDPGVTKGKFMLEKNVPYSIRIVALRSNYRIVYDGGWFRLKTTPCGCAKAKEKCSKATPCCTGLACHLNKVTGKRKCRTKDPTPNQLCANVKEQCGNVLQCCKGLECRADKNTGKLKCRITNLGGGSTQALNMCAAAKEKCGKAKMCCVGLVCRTNKANGMHKCRMKKNGGLGGTTLGG
jgi:hypothetical protein